MVAQESKKDSETHRHSQYLQKAIRRASRLLLNSNQLMYEADEGERSVSASERH